MHPSKIIPVSLLALLAACAVDANDSTISPDVTLAGEAAPMGPHGQPEEPPMLGVHAVRGAGKPGGGGSSPNMTAHGGAIMTSAHIQPIFWGAKWGVTGYPGDKITGLESFYAGLNNSSYANTNTEYIGTNGQVGTAVTTEAGLIDTSTAPARAPKTSQILAEVCKMIGAPVADGYYPVYTDTKRGGAGYCAWHSYGNCGTPSVPVQFAFFFDLEGDSGCDPQDPSGLHSQALAALVNVSGHEYSEAVTDPRNGGWWDASGNENSDKCAWAFLPDPIPLSNGSQWRIQGNWSNAAYSAGTGFANRDGQKGCLYTK